MKLEEIKQQNIDKILLCAIKMFTKYGCDCTTHDMIAKETDLGRRTIFNHFKTKEDLIAAALELSINESLVSFVNYTGTPMYNLKSGIDQYMDILKYLFNSVEEKDNYVNTTTELSIVLGRNNRYDSMKLFIKPMKIVVSRMQSALLKGKEDGTISKDVSVDLNSIQMTYLEIKGLRRQFAFFGDEQSVSDYINKEELIVNFLSRHRDLVKSSND